MIEIGPQLNGSILYLWKGQWLRFGTFAARTEERNEKERGIAMPKAVKLF